MSTLFRTTKDKTSPIKNGNAGIGGVTKITNCKDSRTMNAGGEKDSHVSKKTPRYFEL